MAVVASRRIALLQGGNRYWALAQSRGSAGPVQEALEFCRTHWQPGDQLVFLGSQIGLAGQSMQTMALIASLARELDGNDLGDDLSAPNRQVLWLRGIQEELFLRLPTLHQAKDPVAVLDWMVAEQGFDQLLMQLGGEITAVRRAAAAGAAALAQETNRIRTAVEAHEDVAFYLAGCCRAAVTAEEQLLFVHGGVDPARSLSLQTDAFWWGHPDYFRMRSPYQGFSQVVSTLLPPGKTRLEGPGRLAFDGGCGLGGRLNLLCFDRFGQELFAHNFG